MNYNLTVLETLYVFSVVAKTKWIKKIKKLLGQEK